MTRVLTNRDTGDEDAPPGNFRVYAWRFEQLTEAGYTIDIASMLAEREDIDLHVACELLERGATIHTALRILT